MADDLPALIPTGVMAAASRGLPESIRDRIREARETAGLSHAALGRRLGVTRPSVANWESGAFAPRRITPAEILAACAEPTPLVICGTLPAYYRHRRRRQPIDRECKDAFNAYRRERYRPRERQLRPRRLKPCGTAAAARRHRKNGEPLDPACSTALSDYTRRANDARRHVGITITNIDAQQAAAVRLIAESRVDKAELDEVWLMLGIHPDPVANNSTKDRP